MFRFRKWSSGPWRSFPPTHRFFHGSGYQGGTPNGTHKHSVWRWYMRQLERYPTRTACATTVTLFAAGDVTSQCLEGGLSSHYSQGIMQQPIDTKRLAGTCLYGGLIAGVVGSYWYRALDTFVVAFLRIAPGTLAYGGAKLALECAIYHPFSLCMFWLLVGMAQGDRVDKISQQLRQDFLPTLQMELILWSPVDTFTFFFVPVHLQVIVISTVSFLEAILLSYLHNHGSRAQSHEKTHAVIMPC